MEIFVLELALLCGDSVSCGSSRRYDVEPSRMAGVELTLDEHALPAPDGGLGEITPPLVEPAVAEVALPLEPERARFRPEPLVSIGAAANVVLSGGVDGAPSYGIDALSTRVVRSSTVDVPAHELDGAPADVHGDDATAHASEITSRVRATVVEYRPAPSTAGCFIPLDAPPTCGAVRAVVFERLDHP